MKLEANYKLFEKITGAYYLIPNIEKYFNRIMQVINDELSTNASAIYFEPLKGKWLFMIKQDNKDGYYSKEKVKALSERIYKENYNIIKNSRQIDIPPFFEANIIPIGFEKMKFGLLILYHDKGSLSHEEPILLDQIGFYISAACIGNHLLARSVFKTNNGFMMNKNFEISVKTLIEWRIQEIINDIYKQTLPNQRLFQDIIRETEKAVIKSALTHTKNNQSLAAKFLGVNRNTLRKKIRDLSIEDHLKGH